MGRSLLFVLIAACGGRVGSSDSDGAASDAPAPFDFCAAMSSHEMSCNHTYDPAGCERTKACIETALHPAVGPSLERCMTSGGCLRSADECLASLAQSYSGVPPFSTYASKCSAKRSACASSTPFPEDYCAPKYAVGIDPLITAISACMDLTCEGVPNCFKQALASFACTN